MREGDGTEAARLLWMEPMHWRIVVMIALWIWILDTTWNGMNRHGYSTAQLYSETFPRPLTLVFLLFTPLI
jgi:hypothetical protein